MTKKSSFFDNFRLSNLRGKKNRFRLARFIIFIGFIIVGIVVLSVFIPRAGINVEFIDRSAVMGTMELSSIRISNNNIEPLHNVTIQFGESGGIQPIGTLNSFSSIMVTPDRNDTNFDELIIRANDGSIVYTKSKE
jgi:hypothetical protein